MYDLKGLVLMIKHDYEDAWGFLKKKLMYHERVNKGLANGRGYDKKTIEMILYEIDRLEELIKTGGLEKKVFSRHSIGYDKSGKTIAINKPLFSNGILLEPKGKGVYICPKCKKAVWFVLGTGEEIKCVCGWKAPTLQELRELYDKGEL